MKKKHKAKAKKNARAASKRAVTRAKKRRPTTTNPAPRGALRVPAVNPPEKERKMARKKSKKKSSKKNPAKKRRSKRNPSHGHHAARHASKRLRRRARRNPGTFGEVAAAMGGGVLGGALEIGQEYIPASPTTQAIAGSAATGAAAVGLHFVSRSARDGAIGHLAGKIMRDVRVMLLTKSTTPTDTGKHGLMSFGGDVESGTGRIASGATARALGARRSASGAVTADRFATGVAPGSR